MSCNCKHNKENILRDRETLDTFKEYFVRRMTIDNGNDMRKRDFNQAIFGWLDEGDKDPRNSFQCYSNMDMGMVLTCYEDAMRDFRKRYCDEHLRNIFESGV